MLRVVVVGLGPIGTGAARAVLADAGLELVGLMDRNPEKAGQPATALVGASHDAKVLAGEGPRVTPELDEALADGADVAIVATVSRFDKVAPLIEQLLAREVAVVSSCEQLAWPWYRHGALAEQVDAAARRAGRAVLGVGVNPGFAMDMLPVALGSVLRRVTGVRVVRRVDASVRRPSLLRKIGAGLAEADFAAAAEAGRVGLPGLAESVCLLSAGLGRQVEPGAVEERVEPVLPSEPTPSAWGLIAPGEVAGLRHVARWRGEGLKVELDLTMAVGLTEPKDRLTLEGPVHVTVKVPGAIPGDSGTVAALVNYVPIVHRAAAGLRTLRDVPMPGCSNRERNVAETLEKN